MLGELLRETRDGGAVGTRPRSRSAAV